MIGFAAEGLMELEVGSRTGAEYGEKSGARLQRNGCRDRDWQTRAGSVELRIPRLRTGSCFPSFHKPRRSVEKALTAVIPEACVHGLAAGGRPSARPNLPKLAALTDAAAQHVPA